MYRHHPIGWGVFPLSCGIVVPNLDSHACAFFQFAQAKYVMGIFIPALTVVHAGDVQDIRIKILDIFQG